MNRSSDPETTLVDPFHLCFTHFTPSRPLVMHNGEPFIRKKLSFAVNWNWQLYVCVLERVCKWRNSSIILEYNTHGIHFSFCALLGNSSYLDAYTWLYIRLHKIIEFNSKLLQIYVINIFSRVLWILCKLIHI